MQYKLALEQFQRTDESKIASNLQQSNPSDSEKEDRWMGLTSTWAGLL